MAQLPQHIPAILKPRLRLFMSVDVVGSTKLKQPEYLELDWFLILQSFYGETVLAVQTEWLKLQKVIDPENHGIFLGDPPQFWKTVGDECLYYKDLSDSRQVAITIECWKRALTRVRTFLYRQNKGPLEKADVRLDIKSTIWSAGFPWRNKTIVSPSGLLDELCKGHYAQVFQSAHEEAYLDEGEPCEEKNPRVEFDFVGPGIDIGFRLCSHATIQKMVLSMDVAYILALRGANAILKPEPIYYDGRLPLKGVFAGRDYPLFWIDNSPPDSFEAEESEARAPITDGKIIDFSKTFYQEFFTAFAHRPFLVGDPGGSLTALPDEFVVWMNAQVALYEDWKKREEERRQQADQELSKAGTAREAAKQSPPIDVNELKRRLTEDMPGQPEDENSTPKPGKGRSRPAGQEKDPPNGDS
jgi:hypothetical protein